MIALLLLAAATPTMAKARAPMLPTARSARHVAAATALLAQLRRCYADAASPGPGAERLSVMLRLALARDGTLTSPPQIVARSGKDDANRRYVAALDRLAIATVTACAPFAGLPADLYDASGGWRSVVVRFTLPR